MLPVDQLINNTHQSWSDDFVDKQRWDRRAFARPKAVGDRVLLKQCAFTGQPGCTGPGPTTRVNFTYEPIMCLGANFQLKEYED